MCLPRFVYVCCGKLHVGHQGPRSLRVHHDFGQCRPQTPTVLIVGIIIAFNPITFSAACHQAQAMCDFFNDVGMDGEIIVHFPNSGRRNIATDNRRRHFLLGLHLMFPRLLSCF